MKINKENYEAFFLDYYEGILSPSDIDELLLFIDQHPEVRSEFENFELIALEADPSVQFLSKDMLMKVEENNLPLISNETVEDYLIAELEGNLTTDQHIQLEKFIATYPHFQHDRKLFALTRILPDPSIVFPSKDALKHRAIPYGSLNEDNFEHALLREIEGELNTDEQKELVSFLEINPHLQRDQKLFQLTKLKADTSIVFGNKASLKQSIIPLRKIVYYSLSAAASIILLFSIYNFWETKNHTNPLVGSSHTKSDQVKGTIPSVSNFGTSNNLLAQKNTSTVKPLKLSNQKTVNNAQSEINLHEEIASSDRTPMIELTPLACNTIISNDQVAPEFMFIRMSQMHSNEYLELYYNIKLSEQIQYAHYNQTDKDPEKTLFKALSSRVTDILAFNKTKTEQIKPDVSVWTFAELGVKTYNSLTQDNVKLNLNRDENGKVVSYNLSGDKIDLDREIHK